MKDKKPNLGARALPLRFLAVASLLVLVASAIAYQYRDQWSATVTQTASQETQGRASTTTTGEAVQMAKSDDAPPAPYPTGVRAGYCPAGESPDGRRRCNSSCRIFSCGGLALGGLAGDSILKLPLGIMEQGASAVASSIQVVASNCLTFLK